MHFLVAVILDKKTDQDDIPSAVEKAMDRFDFNYNAQERIIITSSDLALKILGTNEEMTLMKAKLDRVGKDAFSAQYGNDMLEKVEFNYERIRTKTQVQLLAHELEMYSLLYSSNDEEGNIVETGNPDGKYDWFIIAGRWAQSLMITPEASVAMGWTHTDDKEYDLIYEGRGYFGVDICRIKHVDFEATKLGGYKMDREEIKRQFESADSKAAKHYNSDFEEYLSVEKYSLFHSVLKQDGEWVDSDDFSDSIKANEALKDAIVSSDPESWIVIVDCHS
jgi:hypothetical protein